MLNSSRELIVASIGNEKAVGTIRKPTERNKIVLVFGISDYPIENIPTPCKDKAQRKPVSQFFIDPLFLT
jgi:hypothetical protein